MKNHSNNRISTQTILRQKKAVMLMAYCGLEADLACLKKTCDMKINFNV